VSATIRQAKPVDYDPIIVQLDDWWDGRPMRAMLPRLFFDHFGDTSFVAERDGTIVGFLVGFLSPANSAHAYVHFVGVDPNHRGQDLGRRLYQRFFALAAAGRRRVRCVTSPHNLVSVAFHRGLGFVPVSGPAASEGVPYWPDYDESGEDRVLFDYQLAADRSSG
jgi:ribosomal protein S18 acetylase RimI-like enzyme